MSAELEHEEPRRASSPRLNEMTLFSSTFEVKVDPIGLPRDLVVNRARLTEFLATKERALVDEYVEAGFVDVFRVRNPELEGAYTWWSNRKGVRERNVGWRIDYHMVSDSLMPAVVDARLHPSVLGSDHCPLELELDFDLGK